VGGLGVNSLDSYVVYYNLHAHLSDWAGRYLSPAGACRVASITTSRLFSMATVLWDCEDGPYAEALAIGMPVLYSIALSEGKSQLGVVESHPVIPTDEFLSDIAVAYSVVYMAAQMGHWTFQEREDITRAVRMNHPNQCSPEEVERWFETEALGVVPLRRAVLLLNAHTCGGDLICHAADEARQLHERNGLEWARSARRLEALSS
jgi:hypothetical protein